MARYYVKNPEGKWNIFSSIIDDLLFENWVDYDEMVEEVCYELVEEKKKELASLYSDKPSVNTMSYEECMRKIELYREEEEIEDEQ